MGTPKLIYKYNFFLKFSQPFLNSCTKNWSPKKVFVHVDKPLTLPPPNVDKHGFFGNPPSPLSCPHGLWMPPMLRLLGS